MSKSFDPLKYVPFFIGGVFAFIGLVFLLFVLSDRRLAKASQSWSPSSGAVVRSWVVESVEKNDDRATTRSFRPEVQYEYRVDGQTYTSERLHFGMIETFSSQREAAQALDNFPPGKAVTVYYDPVRPYEAVLDRNLSHGDPGIVVGAVILGVGLLILAIASVFHLASLFRRPAVA
jgi:hypothetical protein